jgi:flavin-dependent dehydrogenase
MHTASDAVTVPLSANEVLILGGGLAGCAAAIELARAGVAVRLLERTTGPQHKVCGEFLSAEALGYLASLGIDVRELGAVPIEKVSLAGATQRLPFRAMSLTRSRLDEALLAAAAEAGVDVRRGAQVQALEREGQGWRVEYAQAANDGPPQPHTLHAATVFLATGKHDLRGYPRPAGEQPGLVGLKMYFQLAPQQQRALHGRVELALYEGGYAGLQPVEDNRANLCCLVDRKRLQAHNGQWEPLLAEMRSQSALLRTRLQDAQPLLEKPLAIASIPYGFVRRPRPQVIAAHGQQETRPRLWSLGDQAAVIPSFTGDGMSIALHSGCLAAGIYLGGGTALEFQQRLHDELHRQVKLATLVSRSLVHPWTRRLVVGAARAVPATVSLIARQTRIATPLLVPFGRPGMSPGWMQS